MRLPQRSTMGRHAPIDLAAGETVSSVILSRIPAALVFQCRKTAEPLANTNLIAAWRHQNIQILLGFRQRSAPIATVPTSSQIAGFR